MWLLQRLQALTTLFQVSRPPMLSGTTWSHAEYIYLQGKRVLADQMEFLLHRKCECREAQDARERRHPARRRRHRPR